MKIKRCFATLVVLSLTVSFVTTVYAGNHHGRGHCRNRANISWHNSTDYYDGHYSNECTYYDHAWHSETENYGGHYSYECNEFEHDYSHNHCHSNYHCSSQIN